MVENIAATVILASVAVFGFILILKRNGKKETGGKRPPTMPALPIVGSLPFLRGRMDEMADQFLQLSKKLGPVFSFYSGRNLTFVLNGKKAIVDALVRHAEAFADRPNLWTEANVLNVELKGVSFCHYDEHCKRNRKHIQTILKEFGFGINHESDIRFWNEIEKMIKAINDHKGLPFNPKVLLIRSTANIVMNILFGEEFQTMERALHNIIDGSNIYIDNIDPAIDVAPLIRFLPLYRKKMSKMIEAKQMIFEGVETAIEQIKSNKLAERSFVKRFLEIEGLNYDHQDLLFLIRDICLGAADTTGVVLLWAMAEMISHPEVMTRVQKEIDEVVSRDRLPSYDDKPRLPYTEATLLETARIHTLGPVAIPHYTLKDTQVLDFIIPKGCMVLPNFYSAHMDPDNWTDPKNFRPERFLDKDQNIVGRENVMPFSIENLWQSMRFSSSSAVSCSISICCQQMDRILLSLSPTIQDSL